MAHERFRPSRSCSHDGPRPRARPASHAQGRSAVGPPALRLSLPARRRGDPADGRRAADPLPRHPVPARQPEGAEGDEASGQRGASARTHPLMARACAGSDHPLELRRRLPGGNRGRLPLSARLAGGSPARPRRRLPLRAGGGRSGQPPARPGARSGQGRALRPDHGSDRADQRRQAPGEDREDPAGDRR